jgi:2C-methyl-D-erythritol 2,4-cyclodiphosphate synthase
MLGGVHVTFDRGAKDTLMLTHSLTRLLMHTRALCEGDIGVHFPDKDPQWSGANSLDFLSRVMWLARERSLHVVK